MVLTLPDDLCKTPDANFMCKLGDATENGKLRCKAEEDLTEAARVATEHFASHSKELSEITDKDLVKELGIAARAGLLDALGKRADEIERRAFAHIEFLEAEEMNSGKKDDLDKEFKRKEFERKEFELQEILNQLARGGHANKMREFLDKHKHTIQLVHALDEAIDYAGRGGHREAVNFCIARGGKGVHVQGPFRQALVGGYWNLATHLLEKGAVVTGGLMDLVSADGDPYTLKFIEYIAILKKVELDWEMAVWIAASGHRVENVRICGCHVPKGHDIWNSALVNAAKAGCIDIIHVCEEMGADDWKEARRWAEKKGHAEVVSYFDARVSVPE